MNEPKTKIVATIGPASSSREVLRDLMLSGMDVCRLNFSHGTYGFYAELIRTIRSLNEELGATTAILADLQGCLLYTSAEYHSRQFAIVSPGTPACERRQG